MEKLKNLFIKILKIILDYLIKLKDWFLKNWIIISNYLVIVITYLIVYNHEEVVWAETLLGLWIFASIAYGAFKLFMKK